LVLVAADLLAVGHVEAAHAHAADGRDDEARLGVVAAVGEAAPHVGQLAARRDRDAVVRLLAEVRVLVADRLEHGAGEAAVLDLGLLQAQDVGLVGLDPRPHPLLAGPDRVDVPRGDPHAWTSTT